MEKLLKILLIAVVLSLITVGCSNNSETLKNQIQLTSYPNYVTEGQGFDVKGEYLTKEPNNRDIKITLTVREIGSDQGIYNDALKLTDESQSFSFSNITISNIEQDIYFDLKLIIDGKFVVKADTSSDFTQIANWHTNIITSYFKAYSSSGEPLKSTWNEYLKDENPYYFALPYRDFYYYVDGELVYKDYYGVSDVKNRWIEIYYPASDKYAYAQWEDVGPWNYYDPHYVFSTNDQRPYAEMGIDMGWTSDGYRSTNKAGLDISPDAMEYLAGSLNEGLIKVNWRFIDASEVPSGPWKETISTTSVSAKILNLETKTLRNLQ